jgi:hypothetical protein
MNIFPKEIMENKKMKYKYHIEIGAYGIVSSWNTNDKDGVINSWNEKKKIMIILPNKEIVSYNLERYNYLKITKNETN